MAQDEAATAAQTQSSDAPWARAADLFSFLAERNFIGVGLDRWAAAALLLALAFLLRRPLARAIGGWAKRVAKRTETPLDDRVKAALAPPLGLAPVALGALAAAQVLAAPGPLGDVAAAAAQTLAAIAVFWALLRLIDPLSDLATRRQTILTPELTAWTLKAARAAVVLIGVATVLELWGIRVLPIIAGLGLVGIAVALGAQDLFKNLISGVLILVENRYRVGDWVKVEGVVEGTVETIGFRSTKVRRFDQAPVYVPNARFADGAVVNFREMTHRRISWRIGLEYRATAAQLRRIRDEIEAAILADPRFLKPEEASTFVRIEGFSDSAVDLMIYCFTETRDWGEWLGIKEELALKIKAIVEDAGAGFAFPSRSLYIETGAAPETATAGTAAAAAEREAPVGGKPPRRPSTRRGKSAEPRAGGSKKGSSESAKGRRGSVEDDTGSDAKA